VRYDAFISYSHEPDTRLADALQRSLSRFAKPWYRRRALAVFRDETALGVGPDLWDSIVAALDDSRWFVLLASAQSAGSEWVNRELRHWVDARGTRNLLAVVTDGEWRWDQGRAEFTPDSTAVPQTLRGVFDAEPRHLDVRWAADEPHLDLHNARFRDAIADLAAPIHGRAKDDMATEDVRQHRRTVRVAWSAVTTLVVLLVVAVVAATLAIRSNAQAREARRKAVSAAVRAVTASRIASAQRLAAEATVGARTDLSQSMLLAIEGRRLVDGPQTRGALLNVASDAAPVLRLVHGTWDAAALEPGGRSVLVAGSAGVRRVDLATGRSRSITVHNFGTLSAADVSVDGRRLALAGREIHILDVASGRELQAPLAVDAPNSLVTEIRFTPDGSGIVALMSPIGQAFVYSLADGRRTATLLTSGLPRAGGFDFSADGRWLDLAEWPVMDVHTLATRYPRPPPPVFEQSVAIDPSGERVAVATFDRIFVRDAATGALTGPIMTTPSPIAALAMSPDGTQIAGAYDDGAVTVWDAKTGSVIRDDLVGATSTPLFLRFTSPNTIVLASNRDIVLFDITAHFGRAFPNSLSFPVTSLSLSSDGSLVAAAYLNGEVQVWDLTTDLELQRHEKANGNAPRIAFRPGTTELAETGADGRVTYWDARTGRTLHAPVILTEPNPSRLQPGLGAFSLAFDARGTKLAAVTAAGDVAVIDAATGRLTRRMHLQDPGLAEPVAFSPDGGTIAVGGPHRLVVAAVDGTKRRELENGPIATSSIAFTPNGTLLVAGLADGRLLRLDVHDARERAPALIPNEGDSEQLSFDHAGLLLAASGTAVTLWDVHTGERIGPAFAAPPRRMLAAVLTSDGNQLVGGSENGAVLRFDISSASITAALCKVAGRNLTHQEWREFLPAGTPYHATCAPYPRGK